mgnify:CR=1 FL=1
MKTDTTYQTSFTVAEGNIEAHSIYIENPSFDIEDDGAVDPQCGDISLSVYGDAEGTIAHPFNSDPDKLWAYI